MPASDDDLFDDVIPWRIETLEVGDGHALHVEQGGAPDGLPVVCLHGGPGSGMAAAHRRFFDPVRYRIVQFDQRGCGASTPRGALDANTTADLVADIERLRAHLGIDRWLVFGGSWGATLALAYGAAHPQACLGLIVRGVFLASRENIAWFFDGARVHAPQTHARLAALAPAAARTRLSHWLPAAMLAADAALQHELTLAWMAWEQALEGAEFTPPPADQMPARIDKYRLQAHYLRHACFLDEGWWTAAAAKVDTLPVAILHGAADRVCRPDNARALHAACPGSRLAMVGGCGHNPFAAPMARALVATTRAFAARGDFSGWAG